MCKIKDVLMNTIRISSSHVYAEGKICVKNQRFPGTRKYLPVVDIHHTLAQAPFGGCSHLTLTIKY
jgi:hypothetical protein